MAHDIEITIYWLSAMGLTRLVSLWLSKFQGKFWAVLKPFSVIFISAGACFHFKVKQSNGDPKMEFTEHFLSYCKKDSF